MLTWEFSVLDFIQAHLRSGIGDTVMPFITRLGDGGAIGAADPPQNTAGGRGAGDTPGLGGLHPGFPR